MEAVTIRDCPFCAHDKCVVAEIGGDSAAGFAVHCPECRSHGPIQTDPATALYVWNRRDEIPIDESESDTKH